MYGIRSASLGPALRAVAIACAFLAPSAALGQVVNITNGTDPSAATACPGTTVWIDTFAVKSSTTSTVAVTSVTLTLPTNVQNWVSSISLNSASNGTGTNYGSGTPTGTSLAITTSGLTAPRSNQTALSVYVLATIKADALLTAGTFALTATATAAAPTGGTYADTAPPTTTVDNQAPAAITGLTATPSTGQVDLAWTNPGTDFGEVLVDRRVGSAVTGAPVDGTTYALADPVGTGTVSYVGTAAAFSDTSLTAATYYYALWARDACKNSSATAATASAVVSGAPQTVPGTPGTPSFSSITGTTLSVSWTAATGATSYKVERGPSSTGPWTEIVTGASSPYPDINLIPGTTYWYQVRGTNTIGDGPYSTAASVTTVALPGTPGTPTYASLATTSVSVSWTAATGATSYKVEQGPSSSGPWTQFAGVTSPYPASGLSPGTTYWYQVRGTNAAGDGPTSTQSSVTTLPGTPGAVTFSGIAQTTLTVSWGAATGAASYRVERGSSSTGPWTEFAAGVTGTSTPSSGLTASTTYWYRVRATSAGGDGAYTAAASVTTLANVPGAPGTPTFSSVTQTSLTVSWTAASGATSYTLERGTSSSGPWTAFAATSPYPDSALLAGTAYWYRVHGTNAAGDGPYSTASVTTLPGTTAVGDGSVVPNATMCPSYAGTPVNAFTLSATGAADTVTSVTLSLTPSLAYLNLASVQVTNDAGTVTYGSATPTTSGDLAVGLGAGITGPVGSATQYKVRLVPKAHVDMVATALGGEAYATTARVTAIVGTNPSPTYGDATSGTVTIDNRGPANPRWGSVTVPGTLNWTAPADADVAQVLVLRNTKPITDVPGEGSSYSTGGTLGSSSIVYAGAATPNSAGSVTDSPANGIYYYKLFAKDSCGNYSGVGADVGPISVGTAASEGDPTRNSTKGMVSIVNPDKGTAMVGSFKVQVRVYYPNGQTISPSDLQLSTNGGSTYSTTPAFVRNSNYGTAADRGIFETTASLTAGSTYTLRVKSTGAGGTVQSAGVAVRVNGATSGGGELLMRDNSSQLCTDCHALMPHSTETVGNQYGSWATTCRDCHSAHGTTNVFLVRNQITPPAVNGFQSPKDVVFSTRTGYSATGGLGNKGAASYANADNTGVCQGCHTRTAGPDGTARYRNTGGASDQHYATEACNKCHGHQLGFAPTPGQSQCVDCHLWTSDDVDSYAWNATTAMIRQDEWTSVGHGASASYASGNPPARFDVQGAAIGDKGCLYCHTSSTAHNDPQNYFRLANLSYGVNGPCLVCHAKKLNGLAPPGYDPDPAGTVYALIVATKKVDFDHVGGAKHSPPNDLGGTFCWDCHDPHGDKSATGATLYFMMQKQLVEKPVAAAATAPYGAMWGTPQAAGFAAAYEFNPAIYGATTVWEFQDYYMGGLCTKCHVAWNGTTGVKYYYSTGTYTATVPHDGGGSLRNRCSDCHVHPMGCGGCHNAPPTSGVHDRHDQVLAADQKVNYSAAASEATETLYGFRCVKCHNGTHANEANDPVLGKSSTNPYQVELNFDSAYDPKNAPTAAYTRSGAWSSYQGTNGDYWGWTPAGTCASVYCHSNGAPADVAASYAAAITWQPQGTWSCGSCHGTQAATGSMSKAHALHTGTGGYGFTCEKCHASVAASPTLLTTTVVGGGKMLHVNGVKDVQFDAYLGNSTGGSYGAGRTCSNTYCHSNGTDRTTSNGTTTPPSIAWTSTGVSTCRYCHGGDATDLTKSIGTSPDTGSAKHANHVNKASVIGTNFGCVSCHAATVTANTVIGTKTNHVNAIANVSFAPITGPVSGASRAVGTYSAGCAATWCHSDGRDSPNTSFAPVTWTDTAWNSTAICKGCHGRSTSVAGEPDHATANSHPKHVSASTGASACYDCHRTTVTVAGTAIATTNLHLNGDRDVQMASGTYAMATKTCGNISCHNGGTATWGTTLACADCHSSTNDVDNWNINDGIPAAISTAEWTYSGHGATAAYTSGNPAAGFAGTNPCVYCHDASVSHKLSTNPFRLLNTGGADGQNGNCLICHKTGSPGYTPSGYTAKNRTTSRAVDSTHYGSDHTGTVGASNGGKFCWDCHDPHGDRTSAGGNIYMIHSNVAKQTDGTYGLPTASTTVATVFTAHTTGTDYVRLSSPFNGLCQVCHSVTNHYLSTVADPGPHNSGANCTASCHPHTDSAFTVNEAFKNKGGACTTCHAAQTGSAPRIRARIVGGAAGSEGDDFIRKSRHVSNGTTTSIVTDYDCILCHAEGDLSSNGSGATAIIKTIAANHGGDSGTTTVDLRNVDSAGGTGIAVAWPGQRLQTFTATTAQRDGMDSFCMGCHDSNGASAVAVNKNNPANGMLYSGTTPPTLAQALKPFNVNDNLRNGNEPTTSIIDSSAANSIPTWRTTTNGKIINVKGDGGSLVGFNSGNAVGTGWASHHNLNQFTRRYTTNLTGWTAIWKAYTTKEGVVLNSTAANAGWAAGLHCSDCHLNESNAHGARNAFYMLSDSTGGDVLPASSGTASSTDVCAKCHNPFSSTRYTHGADNSHIVSQKNGSVTLGAASNAAAYLMCLECHAGGAPGAIHGMNGTYKPFNSSTWTSKQYRFQGGGGTWRWYSPNASATGSDATWATSGGSFGCYTQSSGQVDAFGGGCTQHGSGTSSTFNGTGSRPLSY